MAETHSTDRQNPEPEEPRPAIEATNVRLGYGDEPVVAVDAVSIPRGEITALVGPNGSGKTTLLKGFAGDLAPDEGAVLLDGEAVQERPPKELARELGRLQQEQTAPADLTVESLVAHGRYPHRGVFEDLDAEDERAIDRALEQAEVASLRDRPVGDLSGGQKQLAFLAMVLAQEPAVLLLDEPTTYLDLHHQLRVMEVVRQLNREREVTVSVVLHDLQQAARFADRLIVLDDGQVHERGPPGEVLDEGLLASVFGVAATVEDGPVPSINPRGALD
jgi:iron complex transport system ATP-binding protein